MKDRNTKGKIRKVATRLLLIVCVFYWLVSVGGIVKSIGQGSCNNIAQIMITNIGDTTIYNWALMFDLNDEITNISA